MLPVRGRPALLHGCVEALRAQDRPIDDLIVVDDSPAGDLEPLDGVRLLRSGGRGPYAARNLAWRATDADVVLFLDVRSRPRRDWARRLTALFADDTVALAGSATRIRAGSSLGARVGSRHQFFELHKYFENGVFRPYLPTCNLAARRTDLAAVDGFSEIRSGGDADLCWRILARPGRRIEAVPEVLMEWVPRDRVTDYLEQNYRYGTSNHALRRAWAAEGAQQLVPVPHRLLARRMLRVGLKAGVAYARRRDEELLEQLREGARVAFQAGYRVAADRERRRLARRP